MDNMIIISQWSLRNRSSSGRKRSKDGQKNPKLGHFHLDINGIHRGPQWWGPQWWDPQWWDPHKRPIRKKEDSGRRSVTGGSYKFHGWKWNVSDCSTGTFRMTTLIKLQRVGTPKHGVCRHNIYRMLVDTSGLQHSGKFQCCWCFFGRKWDQNLEAHTSSVQKIADLPPRIIQKGIEATKPH